MSDLSQRLAALSPEKRRLLEQRLATTGEIAEPIAIVGMSCRFPGAPDLASYWRLILDGVDAADEIPSTRWNIDELYDATGEQSGKMSVRRAAMVADVDKFDAAFFGIAPREANFMDPQQRLLLEVGWEALELAGLAPERMCGSATGVFVGIGGTDYSKVPNQYEDYFRYINAHVGTGNALSIAANRVSYVFDLHGPSLAVDTACSSSSIAIHLAVQSLRNRECDAALAGGVNLILTPETTIAFSKAHMLSPDGCCRPFDASANGYVRGEGCGLLVLKRLTDALRDGDTVPAVIRASAVNQDGRTSGITAPNARSQQAVIRSALGQVRWQPNRIGYVEAHGTATPLGDPIEMSSLTKIFERRGSDESPCYVGSVKANIGHTETVSGVAGIIKTVLMMRHGVIPAQANFQALNPHIALEGTRLRIASETVEWKRSGEPRAAGVSSFGFGGTNTHILIEEAAATTTPREAADRPRHLLALSAKNDAALAKLTNRYAQHLAEHPDAAIADVCHSANTGRSHFNHRLAIVADATDDLRTKLSAVANDEKPVGVWKRQSKAITSLKTAFLFTGQGSQYAGMGRTLYETEPAYRRTLDECDRILRPLLEKPLLSVLFPTDPNDATLDETAYTQPALFAQEYALAMLWRSWGIVPSLMLGHSVGEYVAACVAGVFSLEHGLQLIAHRARLMQQLPRDGRMVVVFAEAAQVRKALEPHADRVSIAALNGPEDTVISGRSDVVAALVEQFTAAGVRVQELRVSHAFHSPLMEPMLDEFEKSASQIEFQAPKIPLVSNLTGRILEGVPAADYWRRHVRAPVRFTEGIAVLEAQEIQAVVEVGPATTLLGMGRRCLPDLKCAWLPSLRKGQDDWTVMLGTLAELYTLGAKVDWKAFDRDRPARRVTLPTYPFEKTRYWFSPETPERRLSCSGRGASLHPLLGSRVPTALESTLFEVRLSAQSPDYLVDHQVQGAPVVPAAAYIEQALAAAAQCFGPGGHVVADAVIQQAMFLPAGTTRIVQIALSPEQNGARTFEISSLPADADLDKTRWTLHACGRVQHADTVAVQAAPTIDLDDVRRRALGGIARETFYEQMQVRGLAYGPNFQVLGEVRRSENEALAEVRLPASVVRGLKSHHVHPALGDALFQATAGVVPLERDGSASSYTYLPTGVRSVRLFAASPAAAMPEPMFVYAVRTSADAGPSPEAVEADVVLTDASGRVVVQFSGVRVQRVGRGAGEQAIDVRDWLYRIHWQPQGRESHDGATAATVGEYCLIFSDGAGLGEQLASAAHERGAKCAVVVPGEEFAHVPAANGDAAAYRIDPLNEEHYQRLFAETLACVTAGRATIVHLWSLDIAPPSENEPDAFDSADRLGCGGVLQMIRKLARLETTAALRLRLVTRGAQVVDDADGRIAVEQSPLWGLGRVIALEQPDLHARLVDLDPADAPTAAAAQLLRELQADDAEEDQVVYRRGTRHAARLVRAPDLLPAEESPAADSAAVLAGDRPYRLRLGKPGNFDAVRFEAFERRPPAAGQVEIAVRAAGTNFSDVLKVMGLYPGIKDAIVPLGIEASGVVTAVGDGVTRFQVGDEVLGVVPYSFASHALTAEYALAHKPAEIDHRQAATLPVTFLTAYYALCKLGQLRRGERVLIHAGAGGVGLAAIQIAQHLGAEVFATAGSDDKRDYLRQLGVQHVFSSRSLDFAEQIMEATHREGVDVVLNSLPGDAIAKSLSVLRAYGRFLEIGKIDIYQNRMIGLLPFQDNLSYFAIDLDRLLRQRPDAVRKLFDEVLARFAAGDYKALPFTEFPATDVAGALRYMSQRKNTGKVVVSFDSTSAETATREPGETADGRARIRPDATYLITGGLGSLGLQTAEWLTTRGARYLALLSRSKTSPTAETALEALRQSGVEIVVLQGDVADQASLQSALWRIPKQFPPLRGVWHAAGVLDDGLLFDMSLARFEKAAAPKIAGAWNLHSATLGEALDFFVLFSSVACVIGSPGQGNYAAGNAFLDALAVARRRRGLPALSVNWGPWGGSGMAAEGKRAEQLKARGMIPIQPARGFQVMEGLLRGEAAGAVVVDAQWNDILRQFTGRKPTLLADLATTADDDGDAVRPSGGLDVELRRRLIAAPLADRQVLLREHLAGELSRIMGIDAARLDVDQPLNTIGLDSLMAMELKSVVETRLGFSLPMARFLAGPSVSSLAEDAAKLLDAEASSDGGPQGPMNAASGQDLSGASWSPIVPLELGGNEPPIFCVHPLGGDIRCYFQLAQHLGVDRPIYALTARGLEGRFEPHASMADLAADYAAAIRRVQPQGPYHLVGWSTGGIYAYAVAQKLLHDGERIGLLALCDTPLPSFVSHRNLDDHARFLCDYVDLSNHILGSQMRVSYDELSAMTPDAAFETALAEARTHEMLPADASVEFLRRFVEVGRATARLLQQYTPSVIDHPLQVIVPSESDRLAEITGTAVAGDRGWNSELGCRVTVHSASGDHFSMLTGDHAADLATLLRDLLPPTYKVESTAGARSAFST